MNAKGKRSKEKGKGIMKRSLDRVVIVLVMGKGLALLLVVIFMVTGLC